MKKQLLLLSCIITFFLLQISCQQNESTSESDVTSDAATTAVTKKTEGEIYKGYFTFTAESHSFKDLNTLADYWIYSEKLNKMYDESSIEPGAYMYGEVRATYEPPENEEGFAAEYDGVLRVTDIINVSLDENKATPNPYTVPLDYHCQTNEPNLSVRISPVQISLWTPEEVVSFPYKVPTTEDGKMTFESTALYGDRKTIKVVMEEKPCDKMGGTALAYEATIVFDEKEIKGCGQKMAALEKEETEAAVKEESNDVDIDIDTTASSELSGE